MGTASSQSTNQQQGPPAMGGTTCSRSRTAVDAWQVRAFRSHLRRWMGGCVPHGWGLLAVDLILMSHSFIHNMYLLCHSTKPLTTINFQIHQRNYPITTHNTLICTLFSHCYPSRSNLYLSIIGTDVGQHRFRPASKQSSRSLFSDSMPPYQKYCPYP